VAVTKTTVNVASGFTGAQLATGFASALTDGGLLTSSTWYDSFADSGIENRILEVQYDNTKTYGKTYYWFMFTSSGVWVHSCTGWNATTHVPTGTQYLDYFSTSTGTTSNHLSVVTVSNSTNATFTIYKSGTCAWIMLRNSTTSYVFNVFPAGISFQPWADLNKNNIVGYAVPYVQTNGNGGFVQLWGNSGVTRRTFIVGSAMRGSPNAYMYSEYGRERYSGYQFVGHTDYGQSSNYAGYPSNNPFGILVPAGSSVANPAYTSNYYPIINNLAYAPWSTSNMGADFGVFGDYANNTYGLQDTVVVSAGTEEWEVLGFKNNGYPNNQQVSPLFLARVI
jgi:hypothetical protein